MEDKEIEDIKKEENFDLGKDSIDYYNNVIRKELAKDYIEREM